VGAHAVLCSGHSGRVFGLLGRAISPTDSAVVACLRSVFCSTLSQPVRRLRHFAYPTARVRCLVFIGVCVEFVAAVAWLAELFPNRDQREKVLGYTQAFSSFGGLLVGAMNVLAAKIALDLPAIHGNHEAWRYTLISGVIPAIPLILIRPFLPESPEWERKRVAGQLKRPSILALFSPELWRTTVLTTLVFAASYGIAFGAIQQLPQILGAQRIGTPQEGGHAAMIATAKAAVGKATAGRQGSRQARVDTRPTTPDWQQCVR